ncbi:MAG: EthD family reductase [Janthinobacterium lividum]
MTTTITVLYENVDDATFDLDYYMARHMPLVDEKFKPFGMTGWRVLKAVGAPFGGKPAYSVIANLEFDSASQFLDAVAAESGPVFGDVPNFSNKSPVVVIGDLVGAAP